MRLIALTLQRGDLRFKFIHFALKLFLADPKFGPLSTKPRTCQSPPPRKGPKPSCFPGGNHGANPAALQLDILKAVGGGLEYVAFSGDFLLDPLYGFLTQALMIFDHLSKRAVRRRRSGNCNLSLNLTRQTSVVFSKQVELIIEGLAALGQFLEPCPCGLQFLQTS